MEPMFRHVDEDGDRIEFWPQPEGFMLVNSFDPEDTDIAPVRISRDKMLELHAALGEWLYPVHTPEWANRSLIEQMIEKAVENQVAAVLPLHLKSQAVARDSTRGEPCEVVADPDPDPEPHDVGHAEEPTPEHGRLMSELPRRTRPGNTACISCGHGWGEHTAGLCWGTSQMPEGVGCVCTRERHGSTSSTPWNCTGCGHPLSVHLIAGGCLELLCDCERTS